MISAVTLLAVAFAAPQTEPSAASPLADSRAIVIGFESGVATDSVAGMNGFPLLPISTAPEGLRLVQPPPDLTPDERSLLMEALASQPGVAFVESNNPVAGPDSIGCESGGGVVPQGCTQAFYDGAPTEESVKGKPLLKAIKADKVHKHLEDDLVVVAVLDTGADFDHPALAGRFFTRGFDFFAGQGEAVEVSDGIDNDLDGFVDEAFGHGTHVASTIALINPNALILPLKVLDSEGNGFAFQVAQGIFFAVDTGAHMINLSLAMTGRSLAVERALDYAYARGVHVVAAAGNAGTQGVAFPASYPGVLAVGALDFDDVLAPFSNYSQTLHVLAPGVDIYGAMPNGSYAWWSGTSMSAAVATGSLSLVHSLCQTYMTAIPSDVVLLATLKSVEKKNKGFVGVLGGGRVDTEKAKKLAKDG